MAVIAYQYRGELVDQIHRGHIAVTDHTGKILWKLGDPERLTFARSSAKPLQAIPVAESGALEHYGITQQELAVICSSHNGESFHVKAVESILHKAGLSPDQLCCGSEYPMYVPAEDALKIAGIPRAPIYTPSSSVSSRCSLKCAAWRLQTSIWPWTAAAFRSTRCPFTGWHRATPVCLSPRFSPPPGPLSSGASRPP